MFESQPHLLALTGPDAPASLHVKLMNPERSQVIIQGRTWLFVAEWLAMTTSTTPPVVTPLARCT
ncbi:hypothetical protein [Amycolatopsis orientalis]|uniref:hypothetical protein n=1 Tax=Amycolatopsis orientalis TaxID=31958 RepID=UPI00040DCCF5|nr:hypothetical protein [Amycolatopsis orientalis]